MPADVLTILSYLGALFSLGLALLGIFSPSGAMRLVGLVPHEKAPHAVSEVRATYGGVFFGVTAFALATGAPMAFLALASCWICAMLARIFSMIVDGVRNQHNWISIAVEGGIGASIAAPHMGFASGLIGL
jgi:hypothetical protein